MSGKKKIRHISQTAKNKTKINIDFSLNLEKPINLFLITALFIITAGLAYYYIYYSFSVYKEYCFPLDDPWIHLNFARNIAEYGSYSYYKNEMVTAGSTSPLYTLILAAGFLITKNEYLLSYALGILFFSLASIAIFLLSQNLFSENWLGIIAALIFAFDRWLNFFADSGMETSLYVLLLILVYYFYLKRRAVLFGFLLGMTMWVRPDAAAFIFAVIIDYIIFANIKQIPGTKLQKFSKTELIKIISVFGIIILAYFGMNIYLSGTLLPNTYAAKTIYYTAEYRSRANFLKYEVWGYFTDSSYILLIVPFLFGLIKAIFDIVRKKYNSILHALLFIFLLIFLYWYKLPFAAVKGRYLIPVIPFYILISVYGVREFFRVISLFLMDKKIINTVCILYFAITVTYTISAYSNHKTDYSEQTHHISIRNLAVSKWLIENTPENSIIATHDIGAIGYYTRRKIVDVAGLVNPQFSQKLFDPDFTKFIVDEMKRQNVSYFAFIREWYQTVNQKPLFEAGDNNEEIMAIYKFEPDKSHILSYEVKGNISYALQMLNTRQPQQIRQAQQILQQTAALDPQSSLTYYYLAFTYSVLGDQPDNIKYLNKALEIFPEYKDALIALIDTYKKQNKTDEAKIPIDNYLMINPNDTNIIKMKSSLKDSSNRK